MDWVQVKHIIVTMALGQTQIQNRFYLLIFLWNLNGFYFFPLFSKTRYYNHLWRSVWKRNFEKYSIKLLWEDCQHSGYGVVRSYKISASDVEYSRCGGSVVHTVKSIISWNFWVCWDQRKTQKIRCKKKESEKKRKEKRGIVFIWIFKTTGLKRKKKKKKRLDLFA